MPNMRDASSGGIVGIGADEPSGSGTVRWNGRGVPVICGINAEEAGRLPIFPIDVHPLLNL